MSDRIQIRHTKMPGGWEQQ